MLSYHAYPHTFRQPSGDQGRELHWVQGSSRICPAPYSSVSLDCVAATEFGATELIYIGQPVLGLGGGLDYFLQTVFNYPTLAECYKVAALNAANKFSR